MADGARLELDSERALDALRRALAVTGNPQRLLADIGQGLLNSTHMRFREQVAPDGSPWQPLSPSYRRVKSKNANRILWLNGYLGNNIVTQVEGNSVLVGTNNPVAIFHQLGTRPYTISPKNGKALSWPGGPGPRKSVNHPGLPAREFLGASDDDEDMIVNTALRTLNRALDG